MIFQLIKQTWKNVMTFLKSIYFTYRAKIKTESRTPNIPCFVDITMSSLIMMLFYLWLPEVVLNEGPYPVIRREAEISNSIIFLGLFMESRQHLELLLYCLVFGKSIKLILCDPVFKISHIDCHSIAFAAKITTKDQSYLRYSCVDNSGHHGILGS